MILFSLFARFLEITRRNTNYSKIHESLSGFRRCSHSEEKRCSMRDGEHTCMLNSIGANSQINENSMAGVSLLGQGYKCCELCRVSSAVKFERRIAAWLAIFAFFINFSNKRKRLVDRVSDSYYCQFHGRMYYPGQKKKEPSSRFAARRTLFHVWYHAWSRVISAGQKSRTVVDWTSVLLAANLGHGSFFCPG